jgi:hypothetical protein
MHFLCLNRKFSAFLVVKTNFGTANTGFCLVLFLCESQILTVRYPLWALCIIILNYGSLVVIMIQCKILAMRKEGFWGEIRVVIRRTTVLSLVDKSSVTRSLILDFHDMDWGMAGRSHLEIIDWVRVQEEGLEDYRKRGKLLIKALCLEIIRAQVIFYVQWECRIYGFLLKHWQLLI